jgi:hypothetical protein
MKIMAILVLLGFVFSAAYAESMSFTLTKGYNLISVPFASVSFSGHEACGIDRVWTYYDGRYVSAMTSTSPLGLNYASFFVYTRNQCTLTLNNEIPGSYEVSTATLEDIWSAGGGAFNFKNGWNFVAGFADSANFADVKGDCNVVKGPYSYDPIGRRWVSATRLEEGKGYIVKVNGDCEFGHSALTLPPFPE